MQNETSCGIIIFCNNEAKTKFLLIREKRNTQLSFSKGHVEAGETFKETACREVLEEVGLKVEIISEQYFVSKYSPTPTINKTVYFFLGESKTMQLVLQEEELAFAGWFTYEECLDQLGYLNDIENFRLAYKELLALGFIK